MAGCEIKGQKPRIHEGIVATGENNLIDFDKFHIALRKVDLLSCQGLPR